MPAEDNSGSGQLSGDVLRDAVQRVVNSEEFSGSPRLQEFLSYIVQEQSERRADQIKGKTVAADVYGRSLEDGKSSHNVVRVEARRMRRLLDEY